VNIWGINLQMKTLFAIALIVGMAFTGFCGTTNETNGVSSAQTEKLAARTYKITTEFEGNLKHLAGTKKGESNQEMLLRFCKQNGVEIKSPESVFLNEKNGMLFAKATKSHQHKIEQIVVAIQNNVQPSQVH
jgi:hypothetical protein